MIKTITSAFAVLTLLIACSATSVNYDQLDASAAKNVKVCCCASNVHSTIGATSDDDCEASCKASDHMNIRWEFIDSVDTWDEYNDHFDTNVARCKADTGV